METIKDIANRRLGNAKRDQTKTKAKSEKNASIAPLSRPPRDDTPEFGVPSAGYTPSNWGKAWGVEDDGVENSGREIDGYDYFAEEYYEDGTEDEMNPEIQWIED